GSTESIGILDRAHRVLERTGSSSELVFVPYDQVYGQGIEDMRNRKPSIDKVRQEIGWRPALDRDRILADVADGARAAPPRVALAGVAPGRALALAAPAAIARPPGSRPLGAWLRARGSGTTVVAAPGAAFLLDGERLELAAKVGAGLPARRELTEGRAL